MFVRAAHSVRFEEAGGEVAATDPLVGDVAAADKEKSSERDWRPTRPMSRTDHSDEPWWLDVNMPLKRQLDAWCFAEHMDMPVLLQVT